MFYILPAKIYTLDTVQRSFQDIIRTVTRCKKDWGKDNLEWLRLVCVTVLYMRSTSGERPGDDYDRNYASQTGGYRYADNEMQKADDVEMKDVLTELTLEHLLMRGS
jgi:hypothetical protein